MCYLKSQPKTTSSSCLRIILSGHRSIKGLKKLCGHTYVCLENRDTNLLSRDGVFFIDFPMRLLLILEHSHLHSVTDGQDLDQVLPGSRPSIQGIEVKFLI